MILRRVNVASCGDGLIHCMDDSPGWFRWKSLCSCCSSMGVVGPLSRCALGQLSTRNTLWIGLRWSITGSLLPRPHEAGIRVRHTTRKRRHHVRKTNFDNDTWGGDYTLSEGFSSAIFLFYKWKDLVLQIPCPVKFPTANKRDHTATSPSFSVEIIQDCFPCSGWDIPKRLVWILIFTVEGTSYLFRKAT